MRKRRSYPNEDILVGGDLEVIGQIRSLGGNLGESAVAVAAATRNELGLDGQAAAPSGAPTLSATAYARTVVLTWTAPSCQAVSKWYEAQISRDGLDWYAFGSTDGWHGTEDAVTTIGAGNGTTLNDLALNGTEDVPSSRAYLFRVRLTTAGGAGPWSNQVSATVGPWSAGDIAAQAITRAKLEADFLDEHDETVAGLAQEVLDRAAADSAEAGTRAAAIISEAETRAAAVTAEAEARIAAVAGVQTQVTVIQPKVTSLEDLTDWAEELLKTSDEQYLVAEQSIRLQAAEVEGAVSRISSIEVDIEGIDLIVAEVAPALTRISAIEADVDSITATVAEIEPEAAKVAQIEIDLESVTTTVSDYSTTKSRVSALEVGLDSIELTVADLFGETWQPSTAYSLDDLVHENGNSYKVTTAGTSGTSEPTWPGSGTVSDGSVVWTYQGTYVADLSQLQINTDRIASIVADGGYWDDEDPPVFHPTAAYTLAEETSEAFTTFIGDATDLTTWSAQFATKTEIVDMVVSTDLVPITSDISDLEDGLAAIPADIAAAIDPIDGRLTIAETDIATIEASSEEITLQVASLWSGTAPPQISDRDAYLAWLEDAFIAMSSGILINEQGISIEVQDRTEMGVTLTASIQVEADRITSEVSRATAVESELEDSIELASSTITQTADAIAAEVIRANAAEGVLQGNITIEAGRITSEVSRATTAEGVLSSAITQTATNINLAVWGTTGAGSDSAASMIDIAKDEIVLAVWDTETAGSPIPTLIDIAKGEINLAVFGESLEPPEGSDSLVAYTNSQLSIRDTAISAQVTVGESVAFMSLSVTLPAILSDTRYAAIRAAIVAANEDPVSLDNAYETTILNGTNYYKVKSTATGEQVEACRSVMRAAGQLGSQIALAADNILLDGIVTVDNLQVDGIDANGITSRALSVDPDPESETDFEAYIDINGVQIKKGDTIILAINPDTGEATFSGAVNADTGDFRNVTISENSIFYGNILAGPLELTPANPSSPSEILNYSDSDNVQTYLDLLATRSQLGAMISTSGLHGSISFVWIKGYRTYLGRGSWRHGVEMYDKDLNIVATRTISFIGTSNPSFLWNSATQIGFYNPTGKTFKLVDLPQNQPSVSGAVWRDSAGYLRIAP